MGLHSTLPGLLGFARNDIPGRSFNRIEVPPPLQLSSLSPGAHALPVAWRWRIAEVTKNGLKSSTERGPLSFSSKTEVSGLARHQEQTSSACPGISVWCQ